MEPVRSDSSALTTDESGNECNKSAETSDSRSKTPVFETAVSFTQGSGMYKKISHQKIHNTEAQLTSLVGTLSTFVNSRNQEKKESDVNTDFAVLVAKELNQMSDLEKKIKKRKIMEILYE